jgi:hypothetical protein
MNISFGSYLGSFGTLCRFGAMFALREGGDIQLGDTLILQSKCAAMFHP